MVARPLNIVFCGRYAISLARHTSMMLAMLAMLEPSECVRFDTVRQARTSSGPDEPTRA
jgi:hypothetical protein